MKIRFVAEIDVDFDLEDGVDETELNIPAIRKGIDSVLLTEDIADNLVEELTDASAFCVKSLNMTIETPIILAAGKIF